MNVVAYVLWFLFPYTYSYWVSEMGMNILNASGFESMFVGPLYIYWVLFFMTLLALVGLLFFNNLSRILFVLIVITNLSLQSFAGFSVYTGIESLLLNIVNMADGALLVMMYLTSVSNEFTINRVQYARSVVEKIQERT